MNLVLCSQSPRRINILHNLGFNFKSIPPNINEEEIQQEEPIAYLKRISSAKINSSISQNKELSQSSLSSKIEDCIYLSSDTIVVFKDKILHKTSIESEAVKTLESLNGKSHFVHSSLCIHSPNNDLIFDFDTTEVQFQLWSLKQIENYLLEYKPYDKAGSYGIQDLEGPVQNWKGSYTNVLGFPIRKFFQYSSIWKSSLY